MDRIKRFFVDTIYHKLVSQHLYWNAIIMTVDTLLVYGLGFIYWIIAAKFFSTQSVGLVTALVGSLNLIMCFSLLGLDSTIVRYSPEFKTRNDLLSTGLTLSIIVGILSSLIFIIFIDFFSSELGIMKDPLVSVLFVVTCVLQIVFSLFTAVFSGIKRFDLALAKNLVFSVVKLLSLIFLFRFGVVGLFASWTISLFAGVATSLVLYGQSLHIRVNVQVFKKILSFSAYNYLSSLVSYTLVPVIQIILIGRLSSETSAYFFMPYMMASVINFIPNSFSYSLLVEGSHDQKNLDARFWKATLSSLFFTFPVLILVFILGKDILFFINPEYALHSYDTLKILCLASIPFTIYVMYLNYLKIRKHNISILILNVVLVVSVLAGVVLLLNKGITGVAIAFLAGHVVTIGYIAADRLLIKRPQD